jgi:putative DNA primase/helicase
MQDIKPVIHAEKEFVKQESKKALHQDASEKEITKYLKSKIGNVIYVPESDEWYVYDGKIYVTIHRERVVSKALKVLYEIGNGKNENKRKASSITEHLGLISHIDDGRSINDQRNCLILDNCVLDIEDNAFSIKNHSPQIYNTNLIKVSVSKDDVEKINNEKYNPLEDAPIFKKFLNETFSYGVYKESKKTIELVQEMMGYCLTNHTKAQKAFFLKGDGQDGKSVICDVIEGVVGKENTTQMNFESFNKEFYNASIIGKTASISRESKRVKFKEDVNTGTFKALVGGDTIQINIKNKPIQSIKPFCKLIFAVNHYPEVPDNSHGFARRVINIPFRRRVPQNEINTNLANDILNNEFKQVFLFALQGLYRLSKNNYQFNLSLDIKEETEKYLNIIDPYQDFISKKLVINNNAKIKTIELEQIYTEYMEMNDISGNINIKSLIRNIKERNPNNKIELGKRIQVDHVRCRYLHGVGIRG